MKKIILSLILLCSYAYAQDTCQVTATVYQMDGKTPAAGVAFIITRCDQTGKLYSSQSKRAVTGSAGVARFSVPRTVGTDSAYVSITAPVWGFDKGRVVAIPDAATATLSGLVTAATYSTFAVAVPLSPLTDTLNLYSRAWLRADTAKIGLVLDALYPRTGGTGITTTSLRDSIDAEMSIGARLARRISDSLNANPRSSAFDSLAIHQRAHTWTAEQAWYRVINVSQDYIQPINVRISDTTASAWGFRFQRFLFTNGPTGATNYGDQVYKFGYNLGRADATSPEFADQWESKYYTNSAFCIERHMAVNGIDGQANRWMTMLGARNTGRNINVGFNVGTLYIGSADGLHPNPFIFDPSALTLTMDSGAIQRFNKSNTAHLSANNGTGYANVITTSSNTTLNYGSAGWLATQLVSGAFSLTVESAGKAYTNAPTWSGTAGDSVSVSTKGYVDTRLAQKISASDTTTLLASRFKPLWDKLGDRADADSVAAIKDSIGIATSAFVRDGALRKAIADTSDKILTGATRSFSSNGRIYVSDDSISFTLTPTIDAANAALGNVFRCTVSANDTLTVTNMQDGQIITIAVMNAGTNTLAWSGVNWAGGTAPTLTSGAKKRDVFTIIQTGGIMYGSAVQDLR